MKKLIIDVPKGHSIDLEKSNLEKGEIYFTKANYTYKEIVAAEEHSIGYYVSANGVMKCPLGLSSSDTDCRSQAEGEKIIAYIALTRIASYYNDVYANHWVPDIKDKDQGKYIIYINVDGKYDIDCHFLVLDAGTIMFASRELAQKAIDFNKDILDTLYKAMQS